ncbi:MAG: hypothetical protein ACTSPY_06110 [Candidatus Helarchaeota archaeon]
MEYFLLLKRNLIRPTLFYSEMAKKDTNYLLAFATFLLSITIFTLTIFSGYLIFGSDLIYSFYYYQTSTFILEQLFSFNYFGFYISSSHLILIFIENIFFVLKIWIFQIFVIYIISRFLFKQNLNFDKLFEVSAWNYNLMIILGLIAELFLVIRFITPLYYHYIFYLIFTIFVFILIPAHFVVSLGKISSFSLYKRIWLVYTPIMILLFLWTFNHSEIILGRLF